MTLKSAKMMLDDADTIVEREEAIRCAIELGMPLSEIEEYLDVLDMMRGNSAVPHMHNASVEKKESGSVSMD
jgi:DNA-binding transcriptional MerR regulator